MKRGIIVIHDGHDTEDIQQQFLKPNTDAIVSIKPMTSEDWYYQLSDACEGLEKDDEVHVMALHYLGDSMTKMVHAIARLHARGVRVNIAGTYADQDGTADVALRLVEGEGSAARARLTQLHRVAKSRRHASPPKCIFVDRDLFEKSEEK